MHPGNLAIGHPVCDLALQRRIRETRRDRMATAVRRARVGESVLDRIIGRARGGGTPSIDVDPEAFRDRGDDVWKALRF